MPADFGYQFLLRKDRNNNLDIYKLVKTNKFGKKFIEKNKKILKGKKIRLGTQELLKDKIFNRMRIDGVASVKRYPKSELRGR
jgi:hypothetical protein